MKSIRYLEVVLTVIAVCLVWICLRDVVIPKPAAAQPGPAVSRGETMDVRIVGVLIPGEWGRRPESRALPVSIADTLDVRVRD